MVFFSRQEELAMHYLQLTYEDKVILSTLRKQGFSDLIYTLNYICQLDNKSQFRTPNWLFLIKY